MGAWSLRSSFVFSLLIHTLFLMACSLLIIQESSVKNKLKQSQWVEILESPVKSRIEKKEDLVAPVKKQQVVVTEKGHFVTQARPDAFLGERNQIVQEQTVGKTQVFHPPSQKARIVPSNAQDHPLIGKLGLPILSHLKKREQEGERFNPDLDRRWVSEGEKVQDYVKGIQEGNQTALNTREYVFFGYFQRIRERLDRAWVPILRQRLIKYHYSGRKLASNADYSTRVLVVLNRLGEITRVQVLSESGTRDLDDAAVKAFNEAGPFPNPPQGIVDKNGEIEIPWEFILRT